MTARARATVRWLMVVGLGIAACGARAQTLFVATDGSDTSGDGSALAPWATIGHALANVSDGATVLVRPGTYSGRVRLAGRFAGGVTVRSEVPYQARLRALSSTVVTCFECQGITLQGFDIAHSGAGASALVIQIQDLIGTPGGSERVERVTLRDNVIHDSYNNDLLKVNNGATAITIEGNMFYNQSGSDEHIDVNSVTDVHIQDNVFFNDFEGSERTNGNDTGSFVVIKDSNDLSDGILGAERITVRRNVFLNWQGSTGSSFVLVGEDGKPYHEARDVLVENNLMIGNADNVMRAPFGVKGGRDVTFRNNTVVGDLPSLAYAMRLNREGANPANENVAFFNNAWVDPTGTMDAESPTRPNDFSDTPIPDTVSFALRSNLYWNGSAAIPHSASELINYTDDAARLVGDPGLPGADGAVVPRLVPGGERFADGSASIAEAFARLVEKHGRPVAASPLVDAADAAAAPRHDILGTPRGLDSPPDIGALERRSPSADLAARVLAVASLALTSDPARMLVLARVLVANLGDADAEAFDVVALAGPSFTPIALERFEPLASRAVVSRWLVELLPVGLVGAPLVLFVDAGDRVPEPSTRNNLAVVTIPPTSASGARAD